MKKSALLSLAILILGAVPAVYQKFRLSDLLEESRELHRQAGQLGIAVAARQRSAATRPARAARGERARELGSLAAEIAEHVRQSPTTDAGSGGASEVATMRSALDLIRRLAALDAKQLRQVVAQLRDGAGEQDEQARARWLAFALMSLADDHPQAALVAYAECADWIGNSLLGKQALISAIGGWAQLDPLGAAEWLEKNAAKYPWLQQDTAVESLLAGAARHDPQLAFRLLDRLGTGDPQAAVQAIMAGAEDGPQQGSLVLAALRSHLAGIQDPDQRSDLRTMALETMASGMAQQDFTSLTAWLAAENFSTDELGGFASGLNYFITKQDTGRWIDWLGGRLPAEQLADPVREMVGEWTQQDYHAAGTWLSAAADGPAKAAAVQAYAETVAEYEPQVAEQWALTLPPGPEREATLQAIHDNWPAADPAGAEDFARRHHIGQ